jgi:hypothetical protein
MSFDCYCRWSKAWPAFHDLLASLVKGAGAVGSGAEAAPAPWQSSTPVLLELGRARPEDLLLRPVWAWMLAGCLPPGQ